MQVIPLRVNIFKLLKTNEDQAGGGEGGWREISLSISSDHVGGVQEFVSSKTAKIYFRMNCNLFFVVD